MFIDFRFDTWRAPFPRCPVSPNTEWVRTIHCIAVRGWQVLTQMDTTVRMCRNLCSRCYHMPSKSNIAIHRRAVKSFSLLIHRLHKRSTVFLRTIAGYHYAHGFMVHLVIWEHWTVLIHFLIHTAIIKLRFINVWNKPDWCLCDKRAKDWNSNSRKINSDQKKTDFPLI